MWQRAPHQDPTVSPRSVGAGPSMSPCRWQEDLRWDKAIGDHKGGSPTQPSATCLGGSQERCPVSAYNKGRGSGAALGEDTGDNMIVTCWLRR